MLDAKHERSDTQLMNKLGTKERAALRVTPAMAAGVTDKLMDVSDLIRIVDEWEVASKVRQ